MLLLEASRRAVLLVLAFGCAASLASATTRAGDETFFEIDEGRHLVADPRSGLALFGYDPVVYHSEQAARAGSPLHVSVHEGVVWRFTSAANRAAFEQDPKAYLPLFGGHDGSGIADGVMTKGDPEHFLLAGGRLVLFRSVANRDRFAEDADVRRQALANWPAVVRLQAGH